MAYDSNAAIAELKHKWFKQRRDVERTSNLEVAPAIKMFIGDWYVDELGILTREIRARD